MFVFNILMEFSKSQFVGDLWTNVINLRWTKTFMLWRLSFFGFSFRKLLKIAIVIWIDFLKFKALFVCANFWF